MEEEAFSDHREVDISSRHCIPDLRVSPNDRKKCYDGNVVFVDEFLWITCEIDDFLM